MNKKCELLAPAGSIDAFIAAVENGADAIYTGGRLFNARKNADNFDSKEMAKAISFAHMRNVRVYVTVNTLIEDGELEEAIEYVGELYEAGADALIVQDVGLIKLIRECFPDFPIHMSTQASCYNVEGVRLAEEMGCERVVTARELSIDEIRGICEKTDVEIEVFCHGAMCVCYSGQCQMSRFIGGRSGNRGQCAQPCRLRYDGGLGVRHYLSPSDLCLLERIPQLVEAGVKSLKIEGRMKSPEYVAEVVRLYRKYLDRYYEKQIDEAASEKRNRYSEAERKENLDNVGCVSSDDMRDLAQIFNRGGFTTAYFDGRADKEFMSPFVPKHQGIKIGKVTNPEAGRNLIEIQVDRDSDFVMGDGVEIHGKRRVGNVVTYFKESGRNRIIIGDIKGSEGLVSKGDLVYRITSKEQLKSARKTYQGKTFEKGAFVRKNGLNLTTWLQGDRLVSQCIFDAGGSPEGEPGIFSGEICVVVESEPLKLREDGMTSDLTERIREAFGKTGGTPFEFSQHMVSAELGECRYNIAMSVMNRLRRKLISSLVEEIRERTYRNKSLIEDFGGQLVEEPALEMEPKVKEYYFFNEKGFESFELPKSEKFRLVMPVNMFFAHEKDLKAAGIEVIPYISNMPHGAEEKYVKDNISRLRDASEKVYVGNIGFIKIMKEAGFTVYGDYGLNIYNRAAAEEYRRLGVSEYVPSLEFNENEESFPLMVTRAKIESSSLTRITGTVRGRKNNDESADNFLVENIAGSDNFVILPERRRGTSKRSYIY